MFDWLAGSQSAIEERRNVDLSEEIRRQDGGALNHARSATTGKERQLLLLRAQTGDTEALNDLFESCRRRLYCRALRILVKPQDAEDAVQEAMLAAFTRLHQFQGRADFLSWATRIVINAALIHIRKTKSKPTISWDQVDSAFDGAAVNKYFEAPQPTPEEECQRLEEREMLQDALQKLPVTLREVVEFCGSKDYSLREAASALGLSVSALKARLHRGRRALTGSLGKKTRVRPRAVPNKEKSKVSSPSEESLCAA